MDPTTTLLPNSTGPVQSIEASEREPELWIDYTRDPTRETSGHWESFIDNKLIATGTTQAEILKNTDVYIHAHLCQPSGMSFPTSSRLNLMDVELGSAFTTNNSVDSTSV